MQTIALGNAGMRSSILGFGCSAVMGRVGRRASVAALSAAYDAGVTFFDTARSYGYGESEALLGEFLHGRRSSALIATKFGILPTPPSRLKQTLKPVARSILQLAPATRKAIHNQLSAQSSSGHFSLDALHTSLHASLRALRTDYVDFLFLHEPPATVLQQDDLFAALNRLIAAGKVRCVGVAAQPEMVELALTCDLPTVQSVQVPCDLLHIDAAERAIASHTGLAIIGNHPFGGAAGIDTLKTQLRSLAANPNTPGNLREKLQPQEDSLLADAVLNVIAHASPVQIIVPSMLQLNHLRANIAAIEHSRFSSEELHYLGTTLCSAETPKATQSA
ncbi:MAG: aldo/keto reductase [Acidobacteriaceae bacterium]